MLQHSIPHPDVQKSASFNVWYQPASLVHWWRCRPRFRTSKIGRSSSLPPEIPEQFSVLSESRIIRWISTHGCMVRITRLLRHATLFSLFFLASSASVYASDFQYSYKNPSDADAQQYIFSRSNIELINPDSDSEAVYWKPIVGAATLNATTPGTIIYRFQLPKPMVDAKLYMRTTAWHWTYSRGHCQITASRDGQDWTLLAEALTPSLGNFNIGSYDKHLPSSFKGATSIYLAADLYSFGPDAHIGGVRTNTAQHSRYDYTYDNVTFELAVNYEDHLIDVYNIITTYWSEIENREITTTQLVPGESSEIKQLVLNPKSYPISGATLTYGLSVGGGPITTIGSLRNIDIDSGESRWLSLTVNTPSRDKIYPRNGLLIILFHDSEGLLLDSEQRTVDILDERIADIISIIYPLLLDSTKE